MAREFCEDKSRNMVPSSSSGGGGTGFCYSDVSSGNNPTIQTHLGNQIQGFDSNPEIFNLTTGMEMIGFSRNLQQQTHDSNSAAASMWKSFFNKPGHNSHSGGGSGGGGSCSKAMNESTSDHFYQHEFNTTGMSETSSDHHQNLMIGPDSSSSPWQEHRLLVDDSNLRCVFPCEGNERPSQGLSLSLSSANPSTIGLQSFELRHTAHNQEQELRFMNSSSSRDDHIQHHQQMIQDGFLTKPANLLHHQQGQFQLRNSKYLGPAQELLMEFCSLGTKQTDQTRPRPNKAKQWDDENGSCSNTSSRKHSLFSLELLELQKRKTKLLSMLEEVEKRYRHYCDQMKAVVSSFEAVAGSGAAMVYSALASKAMSRHFRCLRDGIVTQILATKKAMGEKDPIAPGTTKGETPRLKVLDQTLRQQRALQQMTMMETHPWRPQRGLPERSVSVLRAWLFEHFLHPYPSDVDKHILARQTGLSRSQVSNWFINARVRLWKPMVEEMYIEETKDRDNNMANSPEGFTDLEDSNNGRPINQNLSSTDQKPTPDQLIRIDSECLSSIISNPDKNNDTPKATKTFQVHHHLQEHQQNFGAFGAVELDFSSYNHHHEGGGVSYGNDHQNFNGGGGGSGGGVSLTLGLQQHGVSQSSLFYPRDHIDECQTVQYSLLDGEGQNLPYRNLMGAQLLHDLAG
ncbi:homeobox protein BEL1 homolog [Mercurialis annua]|uniref:homeobox protein BEL1 homolog n=1 Tax=Mercurialis annua TaxID=3986 RepID=UPI00215E4E84|nr:homeobox protein BEL1 homolog [Mercurialis annua]XP_050228186.1 homeobox protein BEL1 homolog [Mercurialis annua]